MTTFKRSILLTVCMLVTVMSSMAMPQPSIDPDLREAINKGDISYITDWLNNGGDINAVTINGNSALFLASRIGDRPMMKFLLANNPDLNLRNKAGATALMVAAKYGHEHTVDMLLEQGADPTIRNNHGVSAARFALAYEHRELSQKLQNAMMQHYRTEKTVAPNS